MFIFMSFLSMWYDRVKFSFKTTVLLCTTSYKNFSHFFKPYWTFNYLLISLDQVIHPMKGKINVTQKKSYHHDITTVYEFYYIKNYLPLAKQWPSPPLIHDLAVIILNMVTDRVVGDPLPPVGDAPVEWQGVGGAGEHLDVHGRGRFRRSLGAEGLEQPTRLTRHGLVLSQCLQDGLVVNPRLCLKFKYLNLLLDHSDKKWLTQKSSCIEIKMRMCYNYVHKIVL